jgi:hypothetical protein
MITVGKLIDKLQSFPKDARAYAYEGEMTGVIIVDKDGTPLGEIYASESGANEDNLDTVIRTSEK